ncbi:hypothetical protein LguiB_014310 [Lonicera macranthoides]
MIAIQGEVRHVIDVVPGELWLFNTCEEVRLWLFNTREEVSFDCLARMNVSSDCLAQDENLFNRILKAVCDHDVYLTQKVNATGRAGQRALAFGFQKEILENSLNLGRGMLVINDG